MSWRENFGATAKKKILFILGGGLVLLGAGGLAYSLLSPNLHAVKAPPAVVEEKLASVPPDTPAAVETPATAEAEPAEPTAEAKSAEAAAPATMEEEKPATQLATSTAVEASATPVAESGPMAEAKPAATAATIEKWNPRAVKAEATKSRAKRASAKRDRLAEPSREEPRVARGGAYYGWARRRARTAPMEAASRGPSAPSEIAESREIPAEAAPPLASPLKLVDEAIRRLVDANVAFNSPPRARLGKDLEIVAKLSAKMPKETLAREIEGLGTPTVVPLKVSDRVAATLSGGGAFDISPPGPQEQAVSEDELTIWSWKVTPKAAGEQTLILTFDAFIPLQGKDVRRTVRTLTQKISVEVGWPESAGEWLEFIKKQLETANGIWVALLAIGGAVLTWARKISPAQSDAEREATKSETANARGGN